jgi:hypothetical protein
MNKLKVAKTTLSNLLMICNTDLEYLEITKRKERLGFMEAQVLGYLMENSNRLPWIPSSRCIAVVNWYPEDRLRNSCKQGRCIQELVVGDRELMRDIRRIMDHPDIPKRLLQLLHMFLQLDSVPNAVENWTP